MTEKEVNSLDSDLDDLVQKTAKQFSGFFNITSVLQAESIDENIEGVLSRLDELYGMLDLIRNDSNLASDELLPLVRDGVKTLQPVFNKIDRLEEFVQHVKENVLTLEKEVRLVEKESSALTSLKKAMINFPLFGSKKNSRAHLTPSKIYISPEIFSTSDWIIDKNSEEKRTTESDSFQTSAADEEQAKENDSVEIIESKNDDEEVKETSS